VVCVVFTENSTAIYLMMLGAPYLPNCLLVQSCNRFMDYSYGLQMSFPDTCEIESLLVYVLLLHIHSTTIEYILVSFSIST